jgi:cell division septation protein DedD
MRDTSGLEIAKGIHESEPLRNVPIIIITPHGGTVEPRYTLMYGIVDFIKKSFSPEELISKTIDVTEMNSSDSSAVERPVDQPHEQEQASGLHDEEPAIKELQEEDMQFTQTISPQPAERETFPEVLAEMAPESGKGNAGDRPDSENLQKDIEKPEPVVDEDMAADKEPYMPSEEPAIPSPEEDFPDTSSEASRKPKLATFVLAIVLVIVAVGGGAYLYTSLSGKPETTRPAVSVPPSPSQKESPKTEHPPQQALEQLPEKSSPAAVGQTAEKILPSEAEKVQKKEEKSKPTSVKSSPAKEESRPFYSVQVGVFKNKENALALVRHFTKLNYHAFSYATSEKDKGLLYRVLIGRFDEKKEAEAMANKVRSKENTGAMVFAAPGKKK